MKYQLVLQFPESIINIEEIENLESMISVIGNEANLDGHDIGAGEVNFFIHVNDPKKVFHKFFDLLEDNYKRNLKAAYRELKGEEYIILWPTTLKEFQVK